MSEFVFIIGVGRSGTTLLQSLLHSHSSIHFIPETHFIKKYLSREVDQKLTTLDKQKLLNEISKDETLISVSDKILTICQEASDLKELENVTSWVFEQLLKEKSENAVYLGDKDPMNVYYLSVIRKAFPKAKILQIIRDPRDVISSRMKSDWGKKTPMASHVAEYIYGFNKSRKDAELYFEHNYFELKYEELIKNSEQQLKEICAFLNLSFENEMLRHEEKSNELLRKDEGEWKSNVLKPILSDNIEKWRKYLTKAQLHKIEFTMKDVFEEAGYQIDSSSFGIKEKMFKLLVDIYLIAFRLRFN